MSTFLPSDICIKSCAVWRNPKKTTGSDIVRFFLDVDTAVLTHIKQLFSDTWRACRVNWFNIAPEYRLCCMFKILRQLSITIATPRRGRASLGISARDITVIAQFVLQRHNNKIIAYENNCQSDGAQHSRWCLSIANIKISKWHYTFLS